MTTIVDSNLPVARPSWEHSRLESRIVHLGCGAFHRAHQALYTHHLLESTDSDWGICEVNLMPGNDRVLIENLKKQQLLYTVAEKGAESTELKIIGSMKEALHPEIDGCEGILNAMARPQTAIVPLHLRNAPTALMKSWGNHEGYRYAHDWPGAVAPQQYMPDELAGREYYHPNDRGYEHEVKPRLEKIRKILHEKDGGQTGNSDRA